MPSSAAQVINGNGTITVPLLLGPPLPRSAWLTKSNYLYEVRVFYLGQLVTVGRAACGRH